MEKSRVIELIKLDVLDINSKQDAELLQSLKKDSDFPWEEYGYYQNLIALIAATSRLEKPSDTLKSTVVTKLLNYKNTSAKIEELSAPEQRQTEDEKEETLVFEEVSQVVEESAVTADVSVVEHQSRVSGRNNGKARKDPISFREPNYTNIHLLFEEKQTKAVREKEVQSKLIEKKKEVPPREEIKKDLEEEIIKAVESEPEKPIQIPDSHTEHPISRTDRKNPKTRKPEEEFRLTETHKTLDELEKEFGLSPEENEKLNTIFPEKKWYQKKAIISSIAASVIAITIGAVMFLGSSDDTKGKQIQTAGIKTTVSNVQNNQLKEESEIPRENIASLNDVKKVENKKEEQPITNEPKKPALPEPPKLIEAPITEFVENVELAESKTTKEVVKEEAPVIPPKEEKKEEEESPYFVAVEEMPAPIGGLAAIQSKISYPEIARRSGVEGKVFIQAFVDEKGNVIKAEVVKGIGSGCDEAALDAVLKTKFNPGIQRGKAVKVKITIPIVFKK